MQLLVINATGNTLTGFAAAGLTVGPGTFQSIADGTVAAAVDSATAALKCAGLQFFQVWSLTQFYSVNFTIKDGCKQVRFTESNNQGLHQLFLIVY